MISREFEKLQVKLMEHINYIDSHPEAGPMEIRNELEGMSNIIDDMMHEVDRFIGPKEDDRDYDRYCDQRDYESGI